MLHSAAATASCFPPPPARAPHTVSSLLLPAPVHAGPVFHGAARIEDMRREIGVAQHTNGTTNGADELQLIELLDEGTYGKVFRGE